MNPVSVDLYAVDLAAVALSDRDLVTGLPASERDAARPSLIVRALARRLLAARLAVTADAVPITRLCERCGHPTHGRPRLEGGAGPAFGVSHSGEQALVAISDGVDRLGVDLEVIRPRADLERLATRVLGADALARWRSGSGETALERFLAVWTAKEAYLKATGIEIGRAHV